MAVNNARPAPGRVDHAVEEGDEQAVAAFGQRLLPVLGLLPGQAVAEGQEDGQVGEAFLEGGHHLAAAAAGLGGVLVPGAPLGVALLRGSRRASPRIARYRAGFPGQCPARARPAASRALATTAEWSSNQSRSAGVVLKRRKLCRNRVWRRDRLEVAARRLQLVGGERPPAPAEPGEVRRRPRAVRASTWKTQPSNGVALELGEVPAQEARCPARPSRTR